MRVASDSERFQSWLLAMFDARQRDSETISMGPFRAVLTPGEGDEVVAWVTLVDPATDEADAVRALTRLRKAFHGHTVEVEIEYDATAYPQARQWFLDAGMVQVEE